MEKRKADLVKSGRQGHPLSSLLFSILLESSTSKIRKNKETKVICIGNKANPYR